MDILYFRLEANVETFDLKLPTCVHVLALVQFRVDSMTTNGKQGKGTIQNLVVDNLDHFCGVFLMDSPGTPVSTSSKSD